jgi:predicted transcriptional regulator
MDEKTILEQIKLLKEAHALAGEASEHYRRQSQVLYDARVCSLLEGVARTKDDHLNELAAHVDRLDEMLHK